MPGKCVNSLFFLFITLFILCIFFLFCVFLCAIIKKSVACSFCNVKLLWWFRASINSTADLTEGFHTLGKMNRLEWSDLVTLFEVHTLPKIFGVFVRNTSKILSFLVGVLTSCERPLCCVRDFKSSHQQELTSHSVRWRECFRRNLLRIQ